MTRVSQTKTARNNFSARKQRTPLKARTSTVKKVYDAMPEIQQICGSHMNKCDCISQVMEWGLERMEGMKDV